MLENLTNRENPIVLKCEVELNSSKSNFGAMREYGVFVYQHW